MNRDCITLDHGSGGEASHRLLTDTLLCRLTNPILRSLDDSALIPMDGLCLAVTTDSYVVDPLFFPGGDIGKLAVHGTVNDLAMQGAWPRYLTLSLILEEGLPMSLLVRVLDSVAEAARESSVIVVTGDTKVVPRGHADKLFINTSGIGTVPPAVDVRSENARIGDFIIISGNLGEHGLAVLAQRQRLRFNPPLSSDTAPLHGLVKTMLETSTRIHVLRDPTRGGVATALNEIAIHSNLGVCLYEETLPISKAVFSASELLGIDPLYIANEGKCLVFVHPEDGDEVLETMRAHKYGKEARIIGRVTEKNAGRVLLHTKIGGTRLLSMLMGDQLPRIC